MSAVGDLLRKKLQEMLGQDLPNFDDLSALRAVISIHEDDTFFYQQAIRQLNQQNAELKVTEFELRTQLKRTLSKSGVAAAPSVDNSLPLMEKCFSLEDEIRRKEQDAEKLESKILELEETITANLQLLEAQKLEAEQKRTNEKYFEETIATLQKDNAQLVSDLSAASGKNRDLMLAKLSQAAEQNKQELSAKYSGELSELHSLLREGREQMENVKQWTSKLIGLNRDSLKEWTQALNQLYSQEQGRASEVSKPQTFLTEHKQKLQARKYLMNRYLAP